MAKILIYHPDSHCRFLLRYVLEGINHRTVLAEDHRTVAERVLSEKADLLILGADPDAAFGPADPVSNADWQLALPDVPVIVVFPANPQGRARFLETWHGPSNLNVLSQPIEPYPLLAQVKSMLTAPEIWRKGGQHLV